jgi:hypothetical protein
MNKLSILVICFLSFSCSHRLNEDEQWAWYAKEMKRALEDSQKLIDFQEKCGHPKGFKDIYKYDKDGVWTVIYQCPDCQKWFETPYNENSYGQYVDKSGSKIKTLGH